MGLRARYKALETFCNKLKVNSENATFVANAMFWKLGLQNRDQIKAVVDEYMAHMTGEIAKVKQAGSIEVMPDFIDPVLLAKVAEHADSTDGAEQDEIPTGN